MQYTRIRTHHFVTLVVAALLCLVCWPGVAAAQENPLAPAPPAEAPPAVTAAALDGAYAGSLALTPVQDAYVAQAKPTTNYGADPDLLVSLLNNATAPLSTRSLLQWDLSAIPQGSSIERATLELFQTTGTTSSVVIGRVLSAWKDATITWNLQPRSATYYEGWMPPSTAGTYIMHDVTPLVDDWINTPDKTPNFGLSLISSTPFPRQRVFDSIDRPLGNAPLLRVSFQLPPIRVCFDMAVTCQKPVEGAEVFNRTTGETYVTDARGYIPDGRVRLGDSLWARVVDHVEAQATLYQTSGAPEIVDATRFQPFAESNGREMRLAINPSNPLMLYNLTVSAQWYLQDDPARMDWLQTNLIKASDYLYDFSEGQFALGTVHVKQIYEGWDGANIKLHTSSTFHPNANVGGIVLAETPDVSPSIAISYTPGSIYMGSYWNRFGTPPGQVNTYKGQVVPPEEMVDDWAIALAHEFGHYLLFLYDTYTDKNGNSNDAIAALCTGSAMGNAYVLDNQAYIFSQPHWETACGATEAYFRLNGRNEWDTIHAWYDWSIVPQVAVPDIFPPVPLTTVLFDPPDNIPAPLASQVFSLTYQAGETSSGAAQAFLIRDNSYVLEQGKPAKQSTFVELIDARVGDRLCVYDINDYAEANDTPRHQFGCEIIAAGDSNLDLTRDATWSPELHIVQTGPQQLSVTVRQMVAPVNASLNARLIPEHGAALAAQVLTQNGVFWTGVFDLAEPVAPVYLQIWVEETPVAPETRREVMTDRGTGGNGAFGPARLHSGVMALSSDGNASYSSDTPIDLAAGESIAWQSMPGAPPLPPWKRILSQSYLLGAFPPELVAGGAIGLQFSDSAAVSSAAVSSAAAGAAVAMIHFWDGVEWQPIPTTITLPAGRGDPPAGAADGVLLANAPSQGVGVYAVLIDSAPAMFLPLIIR